MCFNGDEMRKKLDLATLIGLILVLCGSLSVSAAFTRGTLPNKDPEALERSLETRTGDDQLQILLWLAEHYISRQPDKVVDFASRALRLARRMNLKSQEGKALIQRGVGYLQSGRLDDAEKDYFEGLRIGRAEEDHGVIGAALNGVAAVALKRGDSTNALANFQRAISHLQRIGDRRRLAGIFNNISLIHYRAGELRKALDFMLKSLSIYEELQYRPGIGIALNSIGNVYKRLNNADQAMEHFNRALQIAKDTENIQLAIGCRVNIGEILKERGNYSQALKNFSEARRDAEKLGSPDFMAVCLNNMADVQHIQGHWSEALKNYKESLRLFEKMNAKPRMVTSHLNLGNVYLDMNKLNLAENHLKRAVRLAADTESRSLHKDAVWSLIRLYEARKDLAQALQHYREYTTLQAQLFSRENYAKLSALQAKYESEQRLREQDAKESNAQIRQLDRKHRILVVLFFVTLIILGAMILLYLYRRYRLRIRTEMELREAYARMERMARYDNLTRLYNRHTILERIEIEMVRMGRTWRPFCLVMADLDDFKRVNDTYGHECGDHLLRHLSAIFHDNLRQADVAARWGGDEILIMLPETDMEGGAVIAGKLRSVIETTPLKYQGRQIFITVTMGINVYNRPGPVSECIRGADRAMYAGKKLGKNIVVRLDEVAADQASATNDNDA